MKPYGKIKIAEINDFIYPSKECINLLNRKMIFIKGVLMMLEAQ